MMERRKSFDHFEQQQQCAHDCDDGLMDQLTVVAIVVAAVAAVVKVNKAKKEKRK